MSELGLEGGGGGRLGAMLEAFEGRECDPAGAEWNEARYSEKSGMRCRVPVVSSSSAALP